MSSGNVKLTRVAKEEFAIDAVTRCFDVEDAMVREVASQCLAEVAPKGDDRVVLALAAPMGDTSFLVRVWVMQVLPAVAGKGDSRAVPAIPNLLEHAEPGPGCGG